MPSPTDKRIGNSSDQNNASGSRMNSRYRVSVSSFSELDIAEAASRERHEHVFQSGRVRGELGHAQLAALQKREQRGNRTTQLHRRELDGVAVASHRRDAVQTPQLGLVH